MTELLCRTDAYRKESAAQVVDLLEGGGIVLDRTPFYPNGGGQPGDAGSIVGPDGQAVGIKAARYGGDRTAVVHEPAAEASLRIGDAVVARIDWETRFKRMRVHTALHLLTAVLPFPVTGGAVGDGEGRLDFDIPDAGLDREDIESRLNALIEQNAAVSTRWISDDELLANPGLVKTMSVKPPMGSGRVRLVEIAGLDLQPCGGTHVSQTGEIGFVRITGIEKKGRQNRRVRMSLAF